MWWDKDKNSANPQCGEMEPLLLLSVAGEELAASEQEMLANHIAQCADCSAALDREKELLALFADHREQPDAALLASCRASLEDALDREEEGSWLHRALGAWIPANWLSPQPAWSAAVLLVIGFSVGMLGPRLLLHRGADGGQGLAANAATGNGGDGSASASLVASNENTSAPSNSAPSALDFHTANVAGMNVFPSIGDNPAEVQFQMKAQEPATVQGTVYDDNVKGVLLHILGGNEAFCPDMRLQAVDLLRVRNNDPQVRQALCHAVHADQNAAVRLKALEALDGSEPQDIVRQTLLDALVDDQNPGVRVEAINELREMAAKGQVVSDDHMLSVLRDRMDKDPSTYIRLQSAAAIRDLGPGH
jgi:hypothetical protein